jgi:hypothetical protein
MLQVRRGGQAARLPRKRRMPARAAALDRALRTGLESLLVSVADRAAEEAVARWRDLPVGRSLLGELAGQEEEDHSFGSAFAEAAGLDQSAESEHSEWARPGRGGAEAARRLSAEALARSAPDLARRTARLVSGWQDHVLHLVKAQNVTTRSMARMVSLDEEPLALALSIGLLGYGVGGEAVNTDRGAGPEQLLTSLFGAGPRREVVAKARADLAERVRALFEEETLPFEQIADAAGLPGESAAQDLTDAVTALEETR